MLGLQTYQQASVQQRLNSVLQKIPLSYRTFFLVILFFGAIAAAIIAPVSSITNIPNISDYAVNLAAIVQAKMAFAAGQFPLRTMPLEYSGWFYPFYQFYSPTTFTFAGLIYQFISPANPLIAYKLTLWSGLTLGGVYLYRLAYWLSHSKPAALLAGVIYLSAPYFIIMINRLGSLNETVALGLLPAVIFYTLQRFYYPQKNILLLKSSIAWYLLITTHIITFVYSTLILGSLLFMMTVNNPRHRRSLIGVGIAYLLSCLMAMWYLAPVITFAKYLVISLTYHDATYITKFHPLLSHLLFSAASYTTNISNTLESLHPAIGLPIVFSAIICVYATLQHLTSGNRRADYWLPYLLMIFFLAFLLAWSPINFWQWLPQPLLVGQYSWRLLGQVSWIGALLSAWAICWMGKKNLDVRHVVIGTLIIGLSTSTWYPPSNNMNVSLADFLKNPRILYNKSSYKINFVKYPEFVNQIDSSLLDNDTLKMDLNYAINKPLLNFDSEPSLFITGNIAPDWGNKHLHLTAYANEVEIGKRNIETGALNWMIDLRDSKNRFTDRAPLRIKFLLRDTDDKIIKEDLPIDKAILTGFLKPDTILRVPTVQPNCHPEGTHSICQIDVPPNIETLALPALYYPNMLKITLDDKPIKYQSIMYEGSLIAGITPHAGVNKIDITFTGLAWGNWTSWFGWILTSLLLIESSILHIIRTKKIKALKLQPSES